MTTLFNMFLNYFKMIKCDFKRYEATISSKISDHVQDQSVASCKSIGRHIILSKTNQTPKHKIIEICYLCVTEFDFRTWKSLLFNMGVRSQENLIIPRNATNVQNKQRP